MKRDNVESAEDLIRAVTVACGAQSAALRWVKDRLVEGNDPKEIAAALEDHLRSAEEYGHEA